MNRTQSRRRAGLLAGIVVVIALIAAILGAVAQGGTTPITAGEVGPRLHLTGNGHLLKPVGRLVTVGDFPDGSAVTPGGRYVWIVDCGHGKDDARIINVATARQVQLLPLPGCYGGVAISPDGGHAYVSGEPLAGNPTYGPTQGDSGDVIHVFSIDRSTGMATENTPLTIPATSGGSGRSNSFPPVSGVGTEYPEGMAVSPDGRYLVVALNGADRADVVTLATGAQTTVKIGQFPEGVAFDPQGRAYISNEYSGTVSVIDPATAKVTATIGAIGGSVGDLASHPEGLVADPHRNRLYVAVTNRDLIAVIDTSTDKVSNYVSVARPGAALGTEPTSVAVSADDRTLYASDAGEDAVAAISLARRPGAHRGHRVFLHPSIASIRRYLRSHDAALLRPRARTACGGPTRAQVRTFVARIEASLRGPVALINARNAAALRALPALRSCRSGDIPNLPAFSLIGRIPTAAYPDSVATTSTGKLIWVAGKGFGSGPNPTYYFGGSPLAPGVTPTNQYGTYVLDMLIGRVGITPALSDLQVRADTRQANAQAAPANAEARPAGSPIPASFGHPSSQIKHVFYIVKENRTYDQVFGSDPRGDGDKSLELFDDNGVSGPTGGITPNAHALTRRFPLFDHFYEDSEVSVDGHLITAGAEATDYAQKATAANYSGRRGTYDFGIFPQSFPPNFFIFDQAAKQNISFTDYGEAVGTLPFGAANNRPEFAKVESHVDLAYPNNLFIGCLKSGLLPTCTQDSGLYDGTGTLYAGQSRVDTWLPAFEGEVANNKVPTLNYMILPEDHTNGTTAGDPTPQAMIADNDLGLGQIVDAISHSKIWSSSAIFVVEDDSQDGADHVDSHRSPAYVISPWTRQGAVVHTRYDQYSVLKTIELITGLQPLALTDALATPMYDAFISGNQTPNDAPYTAIQPDYSLKTLNTAASPNAKLSGEMQWNRMDQVPQAISDAILWQAVHGPHSTPPLAGPNASPDEIQRATAMRTLIQAAHGQSGSATSRAWRHARSCPITWACLKVPVGAN